MRVALFEPDIPQNTGNILRLGACMDIAVDIIEPTGFIFDDKKFKRALMDYVDHVNLKRHVDWNNFFDWSKKNNYRLILLTTKSFINYSEFKFDNSDILIFGRESAGVPKLVHEKVYERITIPMKNGLRSLNVSTAVAITVGEAFRQLNLF